MNRSACFASDEDRAFYLFHLGRILVRARCKLHAYCLMGNHVHLLLTPEEIGACSNLMKGIGQLYSRIRKQALQENAGMLWEGRFKSCLVQSEQYVLACYRYIELNPVRAGLATRADQYQWSSYRANAAGMSNRTLSDAAPRVLAIGHTRDEPAGCLS